MNRILRIMFSLICVLELVLYISASAHTYTGYNRSSAS